ncbi:ABC transporter substrate-binding protein [Nitratireductor sp. CH_MIT9313-5]|uniref:ABC transporter substrate-binding protein n=1 Tax=Nitratireductor sp. CH_MIT9313-5 TaxID=3107764 RepID=UPI0030088DBB
MSMRKTILGATALAMALPAAAMAQSVTLDVTAWKGNETEPAGLPELIEKFEAEHPDIDVELSYISRLDTDVVLPPRLQGNNAPDVMMTDMPLVAVWGRAGLLHDYGTDAEWYGRVDPIVQKAITTGEAVNIMPLEIIGMGNFVNMGLLKKVGIDKAPTTIEELKAACTALDAQGIKPMVFTGGFSAPLFVVANGLQRADVAAAEFGSGDVTFEGNEAFSTTLDTVRELVEAKCFDPKAQAGLDPWSTALTEFKAGNFAMMPQGAWNIADFKKVEGLDFVFAPIPALNEGGVALDLFGIGWSISANSEHKEAAQKFVDFFTRDENLNVMLTAEAAYSPFSDGTAGTPELAAPYDAARPDNVIMFPFATLAWPKPLEMELWDSLTSFLLDIDQDNDAILSRWDETVEDSL